MKLQSSLEMHKIAWDDVIIRNEHIGMSDPGDN